MMMSQPNSLVSIDFQCLYSNVATLQDSGAKAPLLFMRKSCALKSPNKQTKLMRGITLKYSKSTVFGLTKRLN